MNYSTIVADPPWPYDNPEGGRLRAAAEHRPNSYKSALNSVGHVARYGSMTIPELCDLSVSDLAEKNAHLYLWTTNSFMVEAHTVARAWGFKPKTICTWAKVAPDGRPSRKAGYWYRGATEHCLFCVRGGRAANDEERPAFDAMAVAARPAFGQAGCLLRPR